MFDAVAYALYLVAWLVVEVFAFALAVAIELWALLKRGAVASWRWTRELVRDWLAWRRAARELAVRDYPQPHRGLPPGSGS